MRSVRPRVLCVLFLAAAGISLAGTTSVLAQDDFDHCKNIAEDQPRLDCFRGLLQTPSTNAPADEKAASQDLWPLVRTPRPNGGGDAVAITRTAETSQSDPDLAGLMIRCQEKSKIEVLLALVRPVPPRSKRDVTITLNSAESVLHAEALPTGMALALPVDASTFTTGPWHDMKQLSVRIHDPEGDIRGTISLDGLGRAMARLTASCPAG